MEEKRQGVQSFVHLPSRKRCDASLPGRSSSIAERCSADREIDGMKEEAKKGHRKHKHGRQSYANGPLSRLLGRERGNLRAKAGQDNCEGQKICDRTRP